MIGVGIRLGNVFALDKNAFKSTFDRFIQHIRNSKTRFRIKVCLPGLFKLFPNRIIGHMAIARQFMGERPHIAGTLNIVLAAQGVKPDAFATHVARGHNQIGHAHNHGGTLTVFGHTKPVINGTIAARCKKSGGGANVLGGNPCGIFHRFRRIALV